MLHAPLTPRPAAESGDKRKREEEEEEKRKKKKRVWERGRNDRTGFTDAVPFFCPFKQNFDTDSSSPCFHFVEEEDDGGKKGPLI